MSTVTQVLFTIDLIVLSALLGGAFWSVAFPNRRIWPPPRACSWQHVLTWTCFCTVFALNSTILVLDWNSWILTSGTRFIVGVPLAVAGGVLVTWGVVALGVRNTSGLKVGLVFSGPYRVTRNPQYLGDILLFLGLSVIVNSLFLWIAHGLLSIVFLIAPMAEEPWLEKEYGDAYRKYKRRTARFLGLRALARPPGKSTSS